MVRSSRSLHRPWVYPPSDSAGFRRYLSRCRKDDFESLLVCRPEDGVIVGVFNLSQISRGSFQSAYLGFYARADASGQGYMTEGLALVLRYSFRKLKLHRIEANVQPDNSRSLELIERCGFRQEGFSPRYLKVGGRWRDHQRWALTSEEWKA